MCFSAFKFRLFPYSVPVPGTLVFLTSKYLPLWKKNGRKWLMTINNRNWGPAEGGFPGQGKEEKNQLTGGAFARAQHGEVHIPCHLSVSHQTHGARLQIDSLESTIISSEKRIYINTQAELSLNILIICCQKTVQISLFTVSPMPTTSG